VKSAFSIFAPWKLASAKIAWAKFAPERLALLNLVSKQLHSRKSASIRLADSKLAARIFALTNLVLFPLAFLNIDPTSSDLVKSVLFIFADLAFHLGLLGYQDSRRHLLYSGRVLFDRLSFEYKATNERYFDRILTSE
jgi:hypothetical protein